MIVLHGSWSLERDPRGELVLWAEDSEAPAHPPVRRGRRPTRQPHPFACSASVLAGLVAGDATAGTAVLTLPTEGRGPVASVEVERTRGTASPASGRGDGLWDVPILALAPAAALDHLLAIPGDVEAGVEELTAGADLRLGQRVLVRFQP